ncbi:hypothetical protein [Microcoleus sp. EPA2]|uniref:hypothetical protein n=1 Tax=Microcoleus sp. EPA2 TaxID=2841654 RepID=UPI00312B7423
MKSNSAKANIAKNAIGLLLLLTKSSQTFYANLETFFETGDRKMFISLDFTRKTARELIPWLIAKVL